MRIEWLGHACFLVETGSGLRIVMDPYRSGAFNNALRYGPVEVSADIVTASHDHDDHFDPGAVKGDPEVFRKSGTFERAGVKITGVDTKHDPSGGRERGHNVVFRLDADGVSLVHLGDLGHVLTPDQAGAVGRADVVLVPVGGHFTIDARQAHDTAALLDPRVIVPMHFKTSKVDFPIAPVDGFLDAASAARKVGGSGIEVSPDTLPGSAEVWVLEPAR